MTRIQTHTLSTLSSFSIALALAACGTEEKIDATLELPASRDSKIELRPALDVTGLYDPAIADRIVIEAITINIADVRVLGADPRVPTGGLPLLSDPFVLETFDGDERALELPFPGYLADDDLAVFIRLDRSEALENASVIVRGRVYASAAKGGSNGLTATSEDEEQNAQQNRDDELERKHGDKGGLDPDGDPASCGLDPDGDPAIRVCRKPRALVDRGTSQESVPFELRGEDAADLMTSLDTALLDVVIGIPATRWFTPEAMAAIDAKLFAAEEPDNAIEERRYEDRDPIVIESRVRDQTESARDQMGGESDDYFAEENPNLEELKIRRPER